MQDAKMETRKGTDIPAQLEEDAVRATSQLQRLEQVMRIIPPLLETDVQALIDSVSPYEGRSDREKVPAPVCNWLRSLLRLAT